jgi:hypothetical protein
LILESQDIDSSESNDVEFKTIDKEEEMKILERIIIKNHEDEQTNEYGREYNENEEQILK